MRVQDLMTSNPTACRAEDNLSRAAQIMWDCDCGCVPVVDSRTHLLGLLTDRDIAMACYTRGRAPQDILVDSAMAHRIYSVHAGDTLAYAEKLMRDKQVRRLPVLDPEERLIGMLSFGDLVRGAVAEKGARTSDVSPLDILDTLEGIGRRHESTSLGQGGAPAMKKSVRVSSSRATNVS